jgi:hypothetical protein
MGSSQLEVCITNIRTNERTNGLGFCMDAYRVRLEVRREFAVDHSRRVNGARYIKFQDIKIKKSLATSPRTVDFLML